MFHSSTHTEQLIALLYPKLSHPQKSRFSHFFNSSDSFQVNYSFPTDSLSSVQITKPKNRLAISESVYKKAHAGQSMSQNRKLVTAKCL